jgi:methylmalonyl-CoA mutase N-terminal domain/subunit
VQELAFTLADGMTYVEKALERGLNIDEFAPRLSFFFNAHNDFFEEIAKFRAARRIWADFMKSMGAKKERSLWLRFHTQTAGCSLTAQQPMNNVIRTTIQALAAVLGGTQSLHTNSLDEALALPTEQAVKIALRTQQIIAYESNVTNTIDPVGGSYYIEWLTDRLEEEAYKYFDRIEQLGGVLPAIEKGFFQKEIASSAYRYQTDLERKRCIIVGVNKFADEETTPIKILTVPEEVTKRQIERLKKVRAQRDRKKHEDNLDRLRKAAEGTANLMPYIVDCVKSYSTLGEICDTLKSVFGEYRESAFF